MSQDTATAAAPVVENATSRVEPIVGMPKAHVYDSRFGSLREAYALIGYTPEIDCNYLETRAARTSLIKGLADQIAASVPKIKPNLIAERAGGCLAVKDDFFVSLRVARCWQHSQRKCPTWTLRRGAKPRPGLVVIVRMNEENEHPFDYVLAPMISLPEHPLIVSEEALVKRYRCRSESIAGLIRALKRRL